MQVKIRSGHQIELLGPTVVDTLEGVLISHREYNAIIDGSPATITIEELEGAVFPPAVVDRAEAAFDASLTDVKSSWEHLARGAGLK